MPFHVKTSTEITQDLALRTVARSGLSDLTDSSEPYGVLTGVGSELGAAYLNAGLLRDESDLEKVSGSSLDDWCARLPLGGVRRRGPGSAVGKAAFIRTTTLGTTTILAGTQFKSTAGLVYRTLETTQVTVGNLTSSSALAVCLSEGEAGNCDTGQIVGLVTPIIGITSVTGAVPFRGGKERETDAELKLRARQYLAALAAGTRRILEAVTVGLVDINTSRTIAFSKLVDDTFTPGVSYLYIDDGLGAAAEDGPAQVTEALTPLIGGAIGSETFFRTKLAPIDTLQTLALILNGTPLVLGVDYGIRPTDGFLQLVNALSPGDVLTASYTPYIGLIALAQKVIDGDPTDNYQTYPGYKASSLMVRVLAAAVKPLAVIGTILVDDTNLLNEELLQSTLQSLTLDYINNLNIEEAFVPSELIKRVKLIPRVSDFTIDSINGSPPARLLPPQTTAFRSQANLVTYSVVGL